MDRKGSDITQTQRSVVGSTRTYAQIRQPRDQRSGV